MRTLTALATLFLCAPSAQAITYSGNPTFSLTIADDAGDLTDGNAVLDKVRLLTCAGGYIELNVDETIDPVAGWSQANLPNGCYDGVVVFWDSVVTLDGSNTAGTFELEYDQATTGVTFGVSSIPEVPMSPMVWLSGEPCGSLPDLVITIK